MMGYKAVHCNGMEQKNHDADSARRLLYQKRKADLVTDLVDPICVISNANEILESRIGKFVDAQTRSYFEMIRRATMKTKTLIEELRNESQLSRQ
jgi:light-regulated signal transduction histidine kinase (bacteriophytochrome)